jgi:hypothetical protein
VIESLIMQLLVLIDAGYSLVPLFSWPAAGFAQQGCGCI